jgi:hypothetical protein
MFFFILKNGKIAGKRGGAGEKGRPITVKKSGKY